MVSDRNGGEAFTAEDRALWARVSQGIHRLEAQPWTTPVSEGLQVVPLSLPLVFFPAPGWAIARCSLRTPKDLPRNLLVPFSHSP